jgi:hypothetical protein
MRRRRFFALTVAITVLHAIATFGAIAIAFTRGMARFDNPELPEGYLERVCSLLAGIFMQPSGKILTAFGIVPRTSALEWIVLVLNSLLWGAMIALIIAALSGRRQRLGGGKAKLEHKLRSGF